MLFLTWLWKSPNRDFAAQHVNVLRSMLKRHYGRHTLICMTDCPAGLNKGVEALPLPETGYEDIPNPQNLVYPRKNFPSCYRRLWLFSEEARSLGDVIVNIDVDLIILQSINDLFERDATFTGWSDEEAGWNKIAGGLFMLKTGSHTEVWDKFDPETSPKVSMDAGFKGSDQAWMAYCLYPTESFWTNRDGLIKINHTPKHRLTPPNAKIVFTNGHRPPWHVRIKTDYPWVKQHWK